MASKKKYWQTYKKVADGNQILWHKKTGPVFRSTEKLHLTGPVFCPHVFWLPARILFYTIYDIAIEISR